MANSYPAETGARLERVLGPVEAMCIVVGGVIGSGIFLAPAIIARDIGQYGFNAVLLVWVVGGILSLAGALAYAELSGMFPEAGGQYVFLREAFGPLPGFLYGWMEFWVGRAGSMATVAAAFARYAAYFTHLDDDWGIRWTAFLLIFAVTIVNYLGVRFGGAVQVLFTATKVGAIAALIACAFGLPGGHSENFLPAWTGGSGFFSAFGVALIPVLWTYNGWSHATMVSEEMKHPRRDVPRATTQGLLAVTALYLGAVVAYHYLMPMHAVAGSSVLLADVSTLLFGAVGAALAAAVVMISTAGSVNGTQLTGPRLFFAMARDRLFFHDLAEIHPKFKTPYRSIFIQGLWASLLVLVPFRDLLHPIFPWLGTKDLYEQLLTYVIFSSWIFYGMTVVGMLVLRVRRPDLERPYRAWGYPVVPMLFVLASGLILVSTLISSPGESLGGLVIVALGLPAYAAWNRAKKAAEAAEAASEQPEIVEEAL